MGRTVQDLSSPKRSTVLTREMKKIEKQLEEEKAQEAKAKAEKKQEQRYEQLLNDDLSIATNALQADFVTPLPPEVLKQIHKNKCVCCGNTYNKQKEIFPPTFSKIYEGNNYYLPICFDCLDALFNSYAKKTEDYYKACDRVCMNFDIYYNKELVDNCMKYAKPNRFMRYYVQKSQAIMIYVNKTYADTLAEKQIEEESKVITSIEDIDKFNEEESVSEQTIKFWGFGFTPEEYKYLDNKYTEWSTAYPVQAKATESIFQKICMMELQILKGIQAGDKVDGLYKQMNDFMNAAGVQPKQSSETALNDEASLGVMIQRWEMEEPVPKPLEEWKDPDGIVKYVTAFFLGHLSKMFGFKNNSKVLYENEISKYSVKKHEVIEDNITYEDVFGSDMDG